MFFRSAACSEQIGWSGLVVMSAASKPISPKQMLLKKKKKKKKKKEVTWHKHILIIHWKWPIYFNALFWRCDCFQIVQKDISSLQKSRIKPRNKVLSRKIYSSLTFLLSAILFQPSTDKEVTKLSGGGGGKKRKNRYTKPKIYQTNKTIFLYPMPSSHQCQIPLDSNYRKTVWQFRLTLVWQPV